ncbi:hypothetical protein [Streptomyces sp. NPDC091294]|uniref:hypothetical protein n=1 Tax=Streptomyces sp. NPDC091294 TaxID=3365992 RepID=UPI003821AA00
MGEHDRLVADYMLLESSKKNLNDIKKALKGIEEHRTDIHDIWGHESIASKMDEFVDNWDNYRFEKLDLDLKNAHEKKSGKSGRK